MSLDASDVVEHAPFGVVTLDRAGLIAAANATFLALLDASAPDVVARPLLALAPGRDRAALRDALADLDRGRRRVTVEHRLAVVPEDPTWCRTTLVRPAGSALTTAYVEDVTDQRLAVLMLRETERQYRAAFDGAPVGQAVCTLDGVILHANRALARLLGVDVAALHGARLNDHALDESPVSEAQLVELVRGVVASIDVERRLRHASGRTVHAHVHLTLRRDRRAQPSELLVAVTDVTRRTVAEQERAEAITRLQDALADLERSNADLEHFASVASHDLSAPLTTIRGFLDTLDRHEADRLTEQGRTYVAAARRGAERMQSMMTALLEYARRGRAPLDLGSVDLRSVVDGAAAALGAEIEQAGARVHVGPLPVVQADRASLDIVFQNLIANAVKFRRPGVVPHVHVGAARVGDTWHLTVEDNGVGVPAQERDEIFQMFHRRAYERTDGLGIGLATVARAVQRHGGEVWVEEGREGGSRFVVALPDRLSPTSPSTGQAASRTV